MKSINFIININCSLYLLNNVQNENHGKHTQRSRKQKDEQYCAC